MSAAESEDGRERMLRTVRAPEGGRPSALRMLRRLRNWECAAAVMITCYNRIAMPMQVFVLYGIMKKT